MAIRARIEVRARNVKWRPKLDPRFAYQLSLGADRVQRLRAHEAAELSKVDADRAVLDAGRGIDALHQRSRLRDAAQRLFAPLTTGVYFPPKRGEPQAPVRLREPVLVLHIWRRRQQIRRWAEVLRYEVLFRGMDFGDCPDGQSALRPGPGARWAWSHWA